MGDDNPWELFSTVPGWQYCAARLDAVLAETLTSLDASVAGGATIEKATTEAFRSMLSFMDAHENSRFGAGDTEPRNHLADKLQAHLRKRYGLANARVDSFGDIEI